MKFLNPEFLFFMLIPILVFAYLILTDKSSINHFFDKEILEKLLIKGDKLGAKNRFGILFFSFILMTFALARPVIEKDDLQNEEFRTQSLILLDISISMLADDVFPNRLEFAKNRISKLVDELKATDFGIILFAKDAFLLSPITNDKRNFDFLLKSSSVDMTSRQGTDLENVIKKAKDLSPDIKDYLIISDGGDDSRIDNLIKYSQDEKLKINVMVVGTKKGSAIKKDGQLIKDKNGNVVITKRNEILKNLAKDTGGAYTEQPLDSNEGLDKLKSSIEHSSKIKSKSSLKDFQELFYYPLAAAVFLVFIAFHSLPKLKIFLPIILIFFSPKIEAGVFDFWYLNEAKNAIDSRNYEKAAKAFSNLKGNKKAIYNEANMLYKNENYEKAIEKYSQLKDLNTSFQHEVLHNLGNAYAKNKQIKEAIEAYEKALNIKDDNDTKYNLNLLKKQQKNKDDNKQNKQNENNDKQKDKNKQNNKQDNKNKNNQNNKQDENKQDNNEQNQNKEKNQQKKDMQNKNQKNKEQTQEQQNEQKDEKYWINEEAKQLQKELDKRQISVQPIRIGKKNTRENYENNW